MQRDERHRQRNICLKIAYDGTNYAGFQRQSPPERAIQNILEETLQKIFQEKITITAAGRTDAGVHALGQVVNFFTDGTLPTEKLPLVINSFLPKDIQVVSAKDMPKNFNALHTKGIKTYFYQIFLQEQASYLVPFQKNFAWCIKNNLDTDAMEFVLKNFVLGRHDFSSFQARQNHAPQRNPVRTMEIAELHKKNPLLVFVFRADGFLYHMVRNLVAAVVDVGRKKISPEEFFLMMQVKDRTKNKSTTAPASGLFLARVDYQQEIF